jgi:predicted TIM-barrel fold metal-dependent hydrolase
MAAIDSDAHVVESEETFAFIDPDLAQYRPWVIMPKGNASLPLDNEGKSAQREYWVIDGRVHPKEQNIGHNTSKESREMASITARLQHMDELEIDIQVLYPTVFLRPMTDDPMVEYAICKAYNRWLASIWEAAPDRFRWVALPPLRSMDKVEEEMRFAKDHGGVGVFLRGIEFEKQLDNPYFFPMYALGEELSMPMCFHSGVGSFSHLGIYPKGGLGRGKLTIVSAFHQLLMAKVPARFPKLRWAFIEVSSQWIPYALNDLELRLKRRGERMSDTILADNNFYVTCYVTDDLDYVLPAAGEGQLVIGTDYGHHDTATEIEALRLMRDSGKVPVHVADKILDDNARALYDL